MEGEIFPLTVIYMIPFMNRVSSFVIVTSPTSPKSEALTSSSFSSRLSSPNTYPARINKLISFFFFSSIQSALTTPPVAIAISCS